VSTKLQQTRRQLCTNCWQRAWRR